MRKDLNLRMKVLVGIDTRTNVSSAGLELKDLQVVKTLIVPCKLTESSSVITEEEQWRKPGGRHSYGYLDRWGSKSWLDTAWWAPRRMQVRKKDVTHPNQWGATFDFLASEGILPRSNSYPDDTMWRIVIVLPVEIHTHLLDLHQKVKSFNDARRERGRRTDKKSDYLYQSRQDWSLADLAFKKAKTEEQAAALGVAVFRARMAVVKAEGEAERRWPTDLDLKAPGDAGVLGELALALSEDENAVQHA